MKKITVLIGVALLWIQGFAQPFTGFLALDGDNDFASYSNPAGMAPAGSDFTIEMWFRSCGSGGYLFDNRENTTGFGIEAEVLSPTMIQVRAEGISGPAVGDYEVTILPHAWHHFAITFNMIDEEIEVFFDGKPMGAINSDFASFSDYYIGSSDDVGDFFDGYIEEFRVSTIRRYETYFNPFGPFTFDVDTRLLYHFDEAPGATLFGDAASAWDMAPSGGASTGVEASSFGGGAICFGEAVSISAAGGVTYNWSPAIGLDNPASPSPEASPEEDTWYTVTVSDSNSCQWLGLVNVDVNPQPEAVISGEELICEGSSTELSAEGGVIFDWIGTGETDQTITVSPIIDTEYSVRVTDVNGCTDEETFMVRVEDCDVSNPSTNINDIIAEGVDINFATVHDGWKFDVSLDNSAQLRINMWNAQGKLVQSRDFGQVAAGTTSENFSATESGMYIFEVVVNGYRETFRAINY